MKDAIFHSLKKEKKRKEKRIHHIFIQYSTKQEESNIRKYNSYKPIFNSNLQLNKLKTLDSFFVVVVVVVKLDAFSYGTKKKKKKNHKP